MSVLLVPQGRLPLPGAPKADSAKGRQSGGQSFVSELGPLRASVSLARSVTLSQAFLQSSGKGSSKGSDQGSGKSSKQGSVRVSGLLPDVCSVLTSGNWYLTSIL